jgi:hypothetical protein
MKKEFSFHPARSRRSKFSIALTIMFIGAVLAATAAQAQVVSSTQNPLQLALLRWEKTNETTQFPV